MRAGPERSARPMGAASAEPGLHWSLGSPSDQSAWRLVSPAPPLASSSSSARFSGSPTGEAGARRCGGHVTRAAPRGGRRETRPRPAAGSAPNTRKLRHLSPGQMQWSHATQGLIPEPRSHFLCPCSDPGHLSRTGCLRKGSGCRTQTHTWQRRGRSGAMLDTSVPGSERGGRFFCSHPLLHSLNQEQVWKICFFSLVFHSPAASPHSRLTQNRLWAFWGFLSRRTPQVVGQGRIPVSPTLLRARPPSRQRGLEVLQAVQPGQRDSQPDDKLGF
jgi:hypothetical protein